MIGTKLGKYEIIEKIGEGGFAVVYRAKHTVLGHAVAVKQPLLHWSIDQEFSARFRREAEVMARLSPHPHIVQILDIDTIDDEPFFVMEYLPDNLEKLLSERKVLEINQAIDMTLQVCRALQKAHGDAEPIYHRDIHPGNIFLLGDTVKVGDFGLAKLTETGGSISATGMSAGRIGFVAPEQWEDFKHVDHRADLFSVGAVLYRMLVGKSPGGRRRWIEPIAANADVSPRLNQFILKAIEEEPDDRFQSVGQMISELSACTRQANPITETPVDVAQEPEQAAGEATIRVKPQPKTPETITIHGMEMVFVFVKGGTFMMGSDDSNADSNEKPLHQVYVDDFYIGKYQVTQEQWVHIMGSNPSEFKAVKGKIGFALMVILAHYDLARFSIDQAPVEKVSWNDVQEFIRKLNAKTYGKFRLPTEAEWEYAARGGNKSRGYRYSGSNNVYEVAWYGNNSGGKPNPVGTKKSNELGIYDMSGNVWEWCLDWYDEKYYKNSPVNNPKGPASGHRRVVRGGSWINSEFVLLCSYRLWNYPDNRYKDVGFRVSCGA